MAMAASRRRFYDGKVTVTRQACKGWGLGCDSGVAAVSYTHLDVYKRQVPGKWVVVARMHVFGIEVDGKHAALADFAFNFQTRLVQIQYMLDDGQA